MDRRNIQTTSQTASLTQDERSAAARQAIISAAISILTDEGYRRVTFARIQEVAGLSRGLITYHFGSKVKLIEAVIASVRDAYVAEAIDVPSSRDGAGLDAVLLMVGSYLQRLTANPRPSAVMLVLAVNAVDEEPEIQDAVRARFSEMRADIASWLRRGVEDGSVRDDIDVAGVAAAIEGVVRGISLQYLVDRQGFDPESARAMALELVRSSLAPEPRP